MAWRAHVSRSLRNLRSLSCPSPLLPGQIRAPLGLLKTETETGIARREVGGVLFFRQAAGYASSCNLHPAVDCRRSFSTGTCSSPVMSDFDVKAAFRELMAWGWDEIPDSVIKDVKKALAKNTEDTAGQEVLLDVFRAAEASVEFSAILVNIRMALEERTGMTGENVTELPEELVNAITVAYNRYISYVNSFSSEETYLRKKVEAELGTRLIHLKQRVSGLGSEWGEINVIGTSGLSGSYVEQRI